MKLACCLMITAMVSMLSLNGFAAASGEGDNVVPQNVFDGMCESFSPAKAQGVHARYQWDLSGPNGGQWWLEVNDGKYKMGRGRIDNPNVTFVASDETWVAMANGKMKGTWAVLTGRLKVRGSKAVARKLDEIFP